MSVAFKHIVRVFIVVIWLAVAGGVVFVLVAAVDKKDGKVCKRVNVIITGVNEFLFLDEEDILALLARSGKGYPEGSPVRHFDLQKLERLIEKNTWVKSAELYFDNNMVLQVHVSEREPVGRVFTTQGASFYIDSSGHRMPLQRDIAVRLPVFTEFPLSRGKLDRKDTLLLRQAAAFGVYVLKHPVLRAQIAQVHVTPSRTFELVPTIGNHIIQFGPGERLEDKFRRLLIFYREVYGKAGFEKYSTINVAFDGQIVATRKGSVQKVDSIQAMKNIQRLIEEAKQPDTALVFTPVEKKLAAVDKADSTLLILKTAGDQNGLLGENN